MALYTVLSPEQIADALGRFGLPAPERVQPEPKGSVNTNYHVWAGGRRWFLRLNEGKTEADVLFEAEVQRYLHAARFPVAERVAAHGINLPPWAGLSREDVGRVCQRFLECLRSTTGGLRPTEHEV